MSHGTQEDHRSSKDEGWLGDIVEGGDDQFPISSHLNGAPHDLMHNVFRQLVLQHASTSLAEELLNLSDG